MFPPSSVVWLIGYFGLVFGLFWMLLVLRRRKNEGRFPIPADFRAMRRPGEQLSVELAKLDERFDLQAAILLALPLICFALPFILTKPFEHKAAIPVLIAGLALASAGFVYGINKLRVTIQSIRNHRLALFGERLTADQLVSLTKDGYCVFHDVPCEGGSGMFNLDHVVVGRGAVVVVETKTYRKRTGTNGEDHKVTYDGQKLIFPHKTSTEELEQVLGNAEWLRKQLLKKLNIDVPVRTALTFPGWFVAGASPHAPVLVENVKRLPKFIRDRFPASINDAQEDLICRHLCSLCETVTFDAMAA
ncbi:MAG: NERD domain-containing protein [Verrucomicrobiaceae bacterium]|nr:NERD domain-containing protein [Verrucomicrobiaceae bacterium]